MLSFTHFFFLQTFYLHVHAPRLVSSYLCSSAAMPRGTEASTVVMTPSSSAEFGSGKLGGGGGEVRFCGELSFFFSPSAAVIPSVKPNRGDSSTFCGLSVRSAHGFALSTS